MSIVSIRRVESDAYAAIRSAVRQAVEDCGNFKEYIKPGHRVLLKPNLVAVPAFRLSGGVTRYEVVKAMAEIVRELGAEPFIAESSAVGVDTERVVQACGYDLLRAEGIEVCDLKKCARARIPVPGGRIIDHLDTWDIVEKADGIITMPVMKTHDQTEVTLGMKNLKGLISDPQKKLLHVLGVAGGVADIMQGLLQSKPLLCVMDATYCQQGFGPVFGETVHMGLILASSDLVACDAVGSVVMGYQTHEPMITVEAHQRGFGEMALANITCKGEAPQTVARVFKRAHETEIEGLPPYRLLFNEGTCTGCRNTVISALMDLKNQGMTEYLRDQVLVVGPMKELPDDATPENTVLIGKCPLVALKGRGRAITGCPPNNIDVAQAIVGDRGFIVRRYSD